MIWLNYWFDHLFIIAICLGTVREFLNFRFINFKSFKIVLACARVHALFREDRSKKEPYDFSIGNPGTYCSNLDFFYSTTASFSLLFWFENLFLKKFFWIQNWKIYYEKRSGRQNDTVRCVVLVSQFTILLFFTMHCFVAVVAHLDFLSFNFQRAVRISPLRMGNRDWYITDFFKSRSMSLGLSGSSSHWEFYSQLTCFVIHEFGFDFFSLFYDVYINIYDWRDNIHTSTGKITIWKTINRDVSVSRLKLHQSVDCSFKSKQNRSLIDSFTKTGLKKVIVCGESQCRWSV